MTNPKAARFDYPPVEARPEAVEIGGVAYRDPFRWLEEDTDTVVSWQDAQNKFAETYLSKLPGVGVFAKRLSLIGDPDDVSVPVFAGGRFFLTHVPEGRDLAVVDVSTHAVGSGRRVVDLNAMRTDEPLQMLGFVPSPDGKKAIFAYAAGGREVPTFQIIDVDTGKALVDSLQHKQPMGYAWLPDSSGILYLSMDLATSAATPTVFRLDLDRPTEAVPQQLELDHPVAMPKPAADGRHVLLSLDHLSPRPHYIMDTKGDGKWRAFLKDLPGTYRGDILGDNFIAITDDGAPRGRLVSIPLATPTNRETWKEIVPASDHVLANVVVSGERLVLLDLVDTYPRLRVFAKDGALEGEIALPGRGMVNTFGSNYMFHLVDSIRSGEEGEVLFGFSTPSQSPALYAADLATRSVRQLTKPKYQLDAQILDLETKSADGARVIYHVVGRRDLDLSKPRPTVITGYGGFNLAMLPGWLGALWAAWVEAGGVIVLSHLRGGCEFGSQWFEQGRLKLKQNSFNDVFASAEDLIRRRITTAAQLGVIGASNGGVMAAAVAVQRPDLFRASIPQVPIMDIMGRIRDPITMVSSLDYGDPSADPEMAKVIYAWSPYQNIRDGVSYPAILIDCGANDPRCPTWHGRKFAARLQHASVSELPSLLRVRAAAGHGTVGKTDRDRQSSEVLAFFAEHLGLAL